MRPREYSDDMIEEACREILAADERLTVAAVRRRLGGGRWDRLRAAVDRMRGETAAAGDPEIAELSRRVAAAWSRLAADLVALCVRRAMAAAEARDAPGLTNEDREERT
ncbi:MAG: DNA-binding protein [Rhodospirillales bacterium]|nr:DNA-binding protein [Rhodospirillales bacterium]